MFFKDGKFSIEQSWGEKGKPKSINDLGSDKLLNNEKQKRKESNDKMLDILDDEVAKRILKDFKEEGGYKRKENSVIQMKGPAPLPKPSAISSSGNDLLASMAGRLSKLEVTCNNQREEIKDKNKLIDKMKGELTLLKQHNNAEDLLKLKEDNETLQKQVNEMHKFLNDYGMKWVGMEAKDQKREDFNSEALQKDVNNAKPIYKSRLPKELDIGTVERRIEELNIIIANEGGSEIIKDKNGAHVFKRKEPLYIAFYKDGLIIKGYPFYKYSSREARQIMEDILDGYFPSILRHKFPEGCLFKLITKVEEDFAASMASMANNKQINDIGSFEDRIFKPLSKEAFLNELPREVIKNGKIVPIRDAIAQKIGFVPTQSPTKEAEHDGIVTISTTISEKLKKNELSEDETKKVITLKIRTESGKRTLILNVLYSDKISSIYGLIKEHSETKKFEIWGGYPPQPYTNDDKKTLEDLEIFSDSAFNLRAL